jgi:hypothetical protein
MNQQTVLETHETIIWPEQLTSYFKDVNAQRASSAANLFCEGGVLVAPLGIQVRGREAIAAYLEDKCSGMTLYPEQVEVLDSSVVIVAGHVRCPAFNVNVEWKFHLVGTEIAVLQVRLLASLQQLSHLRNSKYATT